MRHAKISLKLNELLGLDVDLVTDAPLVGTRLSIP